MPTTGEFGGQVEPSFFGTWELVNGDGTHARMIHGANGFQKIPDGDPNPVRGQRLYKRDMSVSDYCRDEMSRACRECRDQGLRR